GGDAEPREPLELVLRRGETAAAREVAEMQRIDHRFMPGPAGPGAVAPTEGRGVDDLARPVDVGRLKAGGRIGNGLLAVDDELVEIARPCPIDGRFEPSFGVSHHCALAPL